MEYLNPQLEITETADKEPKLSQAGQILVEAGVHEGEPVSATVLCEIIKNHESEIVEGLSRNWYHPIKISLYEKRWQPIQGANFVILPVTTREERPKRVEADFIWFLEGPDKAADERKRNDGYKLIITLSADSEKIKQEEQRSIGGSSRFIGSDAFRLDRISAGIIPMIKMRDQKVRTLLPDIRKERSNIEAYAGYATLKEFLERALKQPELFLKADTKIDEIFMANHLPLEDADKLKRAIWEFGNYDFKTRDGFSMIGKCLTVPNDFEWLVRQRYGIDLQNCELSGAWQVQKDYTEEEKAELAAEKSATAVHKASIYRKVVVIDWTSRQFGGNRPLPEIIDIGQDDLLKKQIHIY